MLPTVTAQRSPALTVPWMARLAEVSVARLVLPAARTSVRSVTWPLVPATCCDRPGVKGVTPAGKPVTAAPTRLKPRESLMFRNTPPVVVTLTWANGWPVAGSTAV